MILCGAWWGSEEISWRLLDHGCLCCCGWSSGGCPSRNVTKLPCALSLPLQVNATREMNTWAMVSAALLAPTETPGSPTAAGPVPVGSARAALWGWVVTRSPVTTALLELLVMPFLLLLCLFLQACLELGRFTPSSQPGWCGVFEPQGLGEHALSCSGKSSHLNVAWMERGWVGEGVEQKIRKKQIGNDLCKVSCGTQLSRACVGHRVLAMVVMTAEQLLCQP